MTAVLHPAPTDLLPWYERGPDGTATSRDWTTEHQARAEAGPQCTVHLDLYVAGDRDWSFRGPHVQAAPRRTVEPRWKPRGFGGTD